MSVENMPTPEEMGLSEEEAKIQKNRDHDPNKIYNVAHLINAKHGDMLKNMGVASAVSESIGHTSEAKKYAEEAESLVFHEASVESVKANEILSKALALNIEAIPWTIDAKNAPLYEKLRTNNTLLRSSGIADMSTDLRDLEHVAGKLNTKLQLLIEKDDAGHEWEYPVAKLSETSKDITFITNGTGVEMDNNPRLIKITKASLESDGYTLKDSDYESIYPKDKSAEQSEA